MAKITPESQLSLFRDVEPIAWGSEGPPLRGLMVRDPYLTDIITQKKTWELRSFRTKIRGRIGLIKSSSGHVFGEAVIDEVLGPFSFEQLLQHQEIGPNDMAELQDSSIIPYVDDKGRSKTYAWVLSEIISYQPPISYRHPSGAVTFVDLKQLQSK